MSMIIAREHAARGAEYLDQHVPGWLDRIDLKNLHMSSGDTCIIGQVLGDFHRGLLMLHEGTMWAREHGFLSVSGLLTTIREGETSYGELQVAWTELIQERRRNKEVVTVEEVMAVEELLEEALV